MYKILSKIIKPSTKNESLKMALIVRSDLKMTKGKLVAQCSHAAILCYEKCMLTDSNLLKAWTCSGQPKIVLKVDNLHQLQDIYQQASKLNIIAKVVHDAGRTQVPIGTVTCLGLGPGYTTSIDSLVGQLKLL